MIGLLDRSFKKLDKLAFYKNFVYLVDKTIFCVINQQFSQYHGCAHLQKFVKFSFLFSFTEMISLIDSITLSQRSHVNRYKSLYTEINWLNLY